MAATLVTEHANQRLVVVERLDEPERLNPLSWTVFRQLHAGLAELDDDDAVRVVAVTGTGRAFSAGGDLRAYVELQRDAERLPRYFADVTAALEMPAGMHKPVVALVNGVAVGVASNSPSRATSPSRRARPGWVTGTHGTARWAAAERSACFPA